MASFHTLTTFSTTGPLPNSTSNRPFKTQRFKVSCNLAAPDDIDNLILPPKTSLDHNLDRRNLLLGMGSLYTTANLTPLPAAFAAPIKSPDISTCVASTPRFPRPKQRCKNQSMMSTRIVQNHKKFEFPKFYQQTRIRPVAHRATREYIAKYKAAIKAMRALPDDHPHSFVQQAKIHCAYCNSGYSQIASGFPNKQLQIHNSWLFFPFHRWYLYFYERILGKLINDPTFALPYWNWDNPRGMTMPAFFEDDGKKNPAFDAFRNSNHLPPGIADLNYGGTDTGVQGFEQISINLSLMYKHMISNAGDPLFWNIIIIINLFLFCPA